MDLNTELEKYKILWYKEKKDATLEILEIIKEWNNDLEYTYNTIKEYDSIEVEIIDDLYKLLMEWLIFQEHLNNKASTLKISNIKKDLENIIKKEKNEREKEKEEIEKLLDL